MVTSVSRMSPRGLAGVRGRVTGEVSLPSRARGLQAPRALGRRTFLSHQLCSVRGQAASLALMRSSRAAGAVTQPGWAQAPGAQTRGLPRRTSARPAWACPRASSGSASAASGWRGSPRCLRAPSGRSKGIFSYQLEQVWLRQRKAGGKKKKTQKRRHFLLGAQYFS